MGDIALGTSDLSVGDTAHSAYSGDSVIAVVVKRGFVAQPLTAKFSNGGMIMQILALVV